ncbi:MAG: hypothetical protein WDN69_25050 [Aliidongia sp.]
MGRDLEAGYIGAQQGKATAARDHLTLQRTGIAHKFALFAVADDLPLLAVPDDLPLLAVPDDLPLFAVADDLALFAVPDDFALFTVADDLALFAVADDLSLLAIADKASRRTARTGPIMVADEELNIARIGAVKRDRHAGGQSELPAGERAIGPRRSRLHDQRKREQSNYTQRAMSA